MRVVIKTFVTAVYALKRNVMRSALTCIGIIIGIAAVIAMMEIGNGISALNDRAIASLGANNLMIQPGAATSGGFNFGAGSGLTLTPQDCDAILHDCPAVRDAAPLVRSGATIVYGNRNWVPGEIDGTTPSYLDVREWPIVEGAVFSDQDVRNAAKVCVVGQTIKRELFNNENPVGLSFRLQNVNLTIVGVLDRKGASMFGRDQDDIVIAPWTTIKYRISGKTDSGNSTGSSSSTSTVNSLNNLYPSTSLQLYPAQSQAQQTNSPMPVRFTNINNIMAAATSAPEIPLAIKQITEVIRDRHRLRPSQEDDFNIRDMTELMSTASKSTELITKLLLIVAGISLMVGGVGIMNIMLVSVTERTREIGLRMAVGAKGWNVLLQFLTEAVLLCLLGGAIGIALGRGASILVRNFAHWPTAISYPAIIASVVVSFLVGAIFGFYPAWKASRLDPIEALRYE